MKDEKDGEIVQLLGWKRDNLEIAKKISCCVIEEESYNVVIPHYAIAIYYYYRTTVMCETTLRCQLGDLYVAAHNNSDDASIIIPKYVTQAEAPFIYRFATQEEALKRFEAIGIFIPVYVKHIEQKMGTTLQDLPIKANSFLKILFL